MSVLIVGAGIAGLVTGYWLDEMSSGSINLRVFEARSRVGGRIQNVEGFANLDMGAQDLFFSDKYTLNNLLKPVDQNLFLPKSSWRTEDRPILNPSIPNGLSYKSCYKNGDCDDSKNYYRGDQEKDSSYSTKSLATFVDDFFHNAIANRVTVNRPVKHINHRDPTKIVVTTNDDKTYTTDQLVMAVPVTQLRDKKIVFDPPLSEDYTNAFEQTVLKNGKRIFVEFSHPNPTKEKFYEDATKVDDVVYWDASRGRTSKNIVTIQGNQCDERPNGVGTRDTCTVFNLQKLLEDDLDKVYHWRSRGWTSKLVKEIDWSMEQYIETGNRERNSEFARTGGFLNAIDNRIWFVGEYTRKKDGNLSGETGKEIAEEIMKGYCNGCNDDNTWVLDQQGKRPTNQNKNCNWVKGNPKNRCRRNGTVLKNGKVVKVKANIVCGCTCVDCSAFS